MTLYAVPHRLTHRGRYLAVVLAVALAAGAVFVATLVSRPLDAAAGPPGPPPLAAGEDALAAGEDAPAAAAPTADGIDAELAARFAAAQEAAAAEGVSLTITSGKRSAQEQRKLVDEAIEKYGSVQEAHRWVLPPESSAHVQGLALDVGPTDGALWLGQHGLEFGLCRVYANEVWHFEKLPDGLTECPAMHPDSSSGW